MYKILFLFLAILAILGATMTIYAKNYMHSIMFLVLCFFSIAGHYLLLNAGFLAILNVIVYAGAIMVLFLFVVMLLNLNKIENPDYQKMSKTISIISGGLLFVSLLTAIQQAQIVAQVNTFAEGYGGIKSLGKILFNEYVLPFEITALLFLSAMIGAMILVKSETGKETNQSK